MPDPNLPNSTPEDALSGLYRMSRTAGLGSGDYVAISPLAVTTIILGIASALSSFSVYLLIFPLATVVLGFLAFRQIRNSAGTLGGKGIVVIGLLLGIGFLLFQGTRQARAFSDNQQQKKVIIETVDGFGKEVLEGNLDQAWDRCSPAFQERVGRQLFDSTWKSLRQGVASVGKLTGMRSNQRVVIETYPGTPNADAVTLLVIDFQPNSGEARSSRMDVVLHRSATHPWRIERLDDFFPPQRNPGQ